MLDKRPRLSLAGSDSAESSQAELPSEPLSLPPEPQQSPLAFLGPSQPTEPSQVLVRNDPGTYTTQELRSLTDDDRLWLLKNAFRPDSSYKYPHREEYGKSVPFKMHGLDSSLGCAILSHAMVDSVFTAFFLLRTRVTGPLLVSL